MVAEMNASGQFSLSPLCTPNLAVERFLVAMERAAARSFSAWRDAYEDGLADCALDYETRRAVYDAHPLEDLYFAAAVGLEAARIRALFTPGQANILFALIGEKVDAAGGRKDRIISDLVFSILSQVDLRDMDSQKQPHDQVIAILLQRLGIASAAATRDLMADFLFRHHLAAPLALEIPLWWPCFKERFSFTDPVESTPVEPDYMPVAARIMPGTPQPPRQRRTAKRLI
jgi:hypothetical protein